MPRPQHPTRRDFLQGRGATAPLEPLDHLDPNGAKIKAAVAVGRYLLSVHRRAMACDFEIQFPAQHEDAATEHAIAALDLVETIEDQLTVYRNHSEVMDINRRAALEEVEVESRLFSLLSLASFLYERTGGAFDITSGPLSDVWGFLRRTGKLPQEDDLKRALKKVGFQHVQLDERQQTIHLKLPGVAINLNSLGKGYALDRAAELLDQNGLANYLIHGGRSSVLARGHDEAGWAIGLRHPMRPSERLAEFFLCDEALATSGSGTQFFRHRGKRYGHILDPRTGLPAEGIYSATVIAPTAAEADALSTAFYVMGPVEVATFCAARPELRALLVCPAEREGDIQLQAFNLEDVNWRRLQ